MGTRLLWTSSSTTDRASAPRRRLFDAEAGGGSEAGRPRRLLGRGSRTAGTGEMGPSGDDGTRLLAVHSRPSCAPRHALAGTSGGFAPWLTVRPACKPPPYTAILAKSGQHCHPRRPARVHAAKAPTLSSSVPLSGSSWPALLGAAGQPLRQVVPKGASVDHAPPAYPRFPGKSAPATLDLRLCVVCRHPFIAAPIPPGRKPVHNVPY